METEIVLKNVIIIIPNLGMSISLLLAQARQPALMQNSSTFNVELNQLIRLVNR
jgi:hypothetical protein